MPAEVRLDEATIEYRRARQDFFFRHRDRWPGTLTRAFDLLAPCALPRSEIDEILRTVASLGTVYQRSAALLRQLNRETLLEMGVPDYVLPGALCGIPGIPDCVIGRFDLARTENGYKMLEFNSDAPGLLVETFSVNAEAAQDAGKANPNDSGERTLVRALNSAIRAGLKYVGKTPEAEGNIVVTSVGDYPEDKAEAIWLCGLLGKWKARYIPVEALGIGEGGLYDPSGNRIDVLYRVLPLLFIRNELFQHRRDAVKPEMGGILLRLVESRRLALVNPPFAFLLANKALQAVIWGLFESGRYFTNFERRLIEMYMLPTWLDPPRKQPYVVKPAYGAEGNTVAILAADESITHESARSTYSDQLMVYQKYVDLPEVEMMTEYGPRKLHQVMSCFLISGEPVGICMRAGGAVTDESAWVVPISVEE